MNFKVLYCLRGWSNIAEANPDSAPSTNWWPIRTQLIRIRHILPENSCWLARWFAIAGRLLATRWRGRGGLLSPNYRVLPGNFSETVRRRGRGRPGSSAKCPLTSCEKSTVPWQASPHSHSPTHHSHTVHIAIFYLIMHSVWESLEWCIVRFMHCHVAFWLGWDQKFLSRPMHYEIVNCMAYV